MPRALQKLSILSLPSAGDRHWTLSDISTLVGPHRRTLESLVITANLYRDRSPACPFPIYEQHEDILPPMHDLQKFPRLHSLLLSVVSACFLEQQGWILSAPSLRKFIWYQGANLRAMPRLFLDDFDDLSETWVLSLATAAAAASTASSTASTTITTGTGNACRHGRGLEEIFIRFSKDHYTYRDTEPEIEDDNSLSLFVEDRLERLANAIAKENDKIKLSWNTPWHDTQYCKALGITSGSGSGVDTEPEPEPVRHLMMRGTLIERIGIKQKLGMYRTRKGPSFHAVDWHGRDPLWLPEGGSCL